MKRLLHWGLLWSALCCSTLVAADSLHALLDEGHLSVETSLAPDNNIVPGQKVRLTITIATDRWFTGGTNIRIPEVPGLVILQNEQFASNASENRAGQTWVIQRWTLDLFPQRAGDFTVPPLRLNTAVNTDNAGDVEGELFAPAITFTVQLPEALADAQQWVAAPAFSASQQFDRDPDTLQTGDALEQSIHFEGSDVMAMMLPTYEPVQIDGLKAYASPPTLEDSSNRGELIGRRHIGVSYIAEKPGTYALPEREFFWWNTQSRELSLVTLPETTINVAGASSTEHDPGTGFDTTTLLRWLTVAAALLFIYGAIKAVIPHLPGFSARVTMLMSRLRALTKPALPRRLNPDSSAGD